MKNSDLHPGLNRIMILILFLCFKAVSGKAQNLPEAVLSLKNAITTQNHIILTSSISTSFMISVYDGHRASQMIEGLIKHYKDLTDIEYLSSNSTKKGQNIQVVCRFQNSKSFQSVISLNHQGKIERIRFFDKLYGCNVEDSSKFVTRIPFVFAGSKIIVRLRINESPKLLSMLFDTGADGVGLKKSVADEIGVFENRKQNTNVVGASMQIGISERNTLVFDSLKIPNQNIGLFPNYTDSLDGLFGAAFLRNYITYIDFENSVIELYNYGEKVYPEGFTAIPLHFTGLPAITAKTELNSGKELDATLLFDTGASYSFILFGGSVNRNDLLEGFTVQTRGNTVSFGQSTPTVTGLVNSFSFGNLTLTDFTATLQTQSKNDKSFQEESDGSLGIEIIKKYNWYINLAERQFQMKPNRYFTELLPFWLDRYMFGFDKDRLKVVSVNAMNPTEVLPIRPGDFIESMNGEAPYEYFKTNKIKEFQSILKTSEIELVVERNRQQFLVSLPTK